MRRAASSVRVLLCVLLAAVSVAAARAHASPPDLFGLGSRSAALAMTGASYADSEEAVFINPAGLGRARERGFTLGVAAGAFDVTLDDERFALESLQAITLGLLVPLPFGGALQDRVVLGVQLSTPPEATLRGEIAYPEVPQFPVLARTQVLSFQTGLGLDLSALLAGLRLGASISMLASVVGDVGLTLSSDQRVETDVSSKIVASTAPIIGLTWDVGLFSLGLVYRGSVETSMDFDIETAGLPVAAPILTVGGLLEYVPSTLVLEAAARPTSDWLLVTQVAARAWSEWPGPQQATSTSSAQAPDPRFSTVFSPRVAAERTVRHGRLGLALRGGYAWEPSPAPPARVQETRADDAGEVPLRYLDNDRHVWTAGMGLSWRLGPTESLRLDGFAQVHWLAPREHEIAQQGALGPMRTSGAILVGGWSVGARW